MKRILLIIFLILFLSQSALIATNICPLMMHSVFKLSGHEKNGNPCFGTCFFISKRTRSGQYQPILITATHVLKHMYGNTVLIDLRYKDKNGYKIIPSKIRIRNGKQIMWSKLGDIAAIKVKLPSNIDINILSSDFLASNKQIAKYRINTGTRALVIGYPYGTGFGKAQFPILRNACLSSYPINFQQSFLLDFNISEGYSGAPVIIQTNNSAFIIGIITQEVFL